MFLNNFYNLFMASCYGYGETPCTAVDTSGVTRKIYNGNASGSCVLCAFPQNSANSGYLPVKIATYTTGSYVYFGSGTTPVTIDDYCLEAPYTKTTVVDVVSQTSARMVKDNTVTLEYTYVLKNLSNADIVIGEIGLGGRFAYSNSSNIQCLVDRTVLSSPVTIAPGESEQITYTIVYNCPVPEAT